MRNIDEEIARQLQASAANGELASAQSYGKPLADIAGWEDTPAALRMPFKVLKDAGAAPMEIAMFHERARLRDALAGAGTDQERKRLQQQLSEHEQALSMRLESLRANAIV
jgi:hypothetical protein